jgi:hypothetical protein
MQLPVTNYSFTWCSVATNVIFNTCFGNIICYIGKFYFENIFLKLSFPIDWRELY